MSFIVKIILLSSFSYACIYADDSIYEDSYIDDTHNVLSDTVSDLSTSIDNMFSNTFSDSNTTSNNKITKKADSLDSFFQTKKFIEETDETFVLINFNSIFQSNGTHDFKYKIRAHVPLSRTKKNYNLFIEDITQDTVQNVLSNETLHDSSTPDIGINFFSPTTYGINSKYSIGTSGINPFVRARFNLNFKTKKWNIEPVQQFKYSTKHGFEEETNIYFDNLLSNSELLRYTVYRGTNENTEGMNYSFSASYVKTISQKTAVSISQVFFGNTKYQHITYNPNMTTNSTTFKGISSYFTSVNFRQNIWKKWFYYSLSPGVGFNRANEYKANYSMLFSIDMYFGKLYKK